MFEDIPRPALWKRLLLGAFLVVFAAAGATAVAAFHEVDKVVSALELGTELKLGKNTLADSDPGQPQTLLILGSDRRPKANGEGASGARSDTIMLVRLNPDKEATAIMSLPRDLKVRIPGHGVEKINAAYEYGGPALTLQTVKQLTGLPINHVVNVTFKGFWRAVNAIGCVYTDVDRDYFNDSAEFTFIDIDPGYQRLCARAGAPVRALPPLRHGPRPLRAPAGLPAPDEAAGHLHRADREPRPAREDLRSQHRHGRHPAQQVGGAAAREAGRLLGRPADPGDPLRGRDRAELRRGQRRPGEEARPAVPQGRGLARSAWRGA